MNIDEELDKARKEAYSAARSATGLAPYSAADSAAWSAAFSATDSSARSATRSVVWSAAESARYVEKSSGLEEKQRQVEMVKDIL